MAIKVAVIGAGPFGLLGVKNLKEEGFDVTAFERRSYVGGIWKHTQDGRISVVPNTIFNSSRSRSAFTDFPFNDKVDDYPTAPQIYDYIQDYADHFELRPHIRFNTSVNTMRRANGKWELELQATDDKEPHIELFDKVMVASGSFQTPKYPTIEGIELFDKANVTHALNYTPSDEYKDKNVLIVGFHASSIDTSESLHQCKAKQVYMSRRNGVLLLAKFDSAGRTFDQAQTFNLCTFIGVAEAYCPRLFYWMMDTAMASASRKAFPSMKKYNHFLPAPSLATTTPVAADMVIPHIESGFVEPVTGVRRVTGPRSVELTDGRVLTDVDKIIYCTGYYFDQPFMPDEYAPMPVHGRPPKLYQNIFSLHSDPEVRDNLGFLGQGAAFLSGFTVFELQAQAITQVWKGNSKLPSYDEQMAWYRANVQDYDSKDARMTSNATHYAVLLPLGETIRFLNDTCGLGLENLGYWSWKGWSLWWRDPELYKICRSKLLSPAIFRLFDVGKRKAWAGARAQVFYDNEFADKRAAERLKKGLKNGEPKKER